MNLTYTPSSLAKEDRWLCSLNHWCCVPLCWPECPWLHSFQALPSPSAQMGSGATVRGAVSQLPCLGGWRRIHSRQLSVSQAGSPVGRCWVPPLALAVNCFLYLWPVLALLWKKSALIPLGMRVAGLHGFQMPLAAHLVRSGQKTFSTAGGGVIKLPAC